MLNFNLLLNKSKEDAKNKIFFLKMLFIKEIDNYLRILKNNSPYITREKFYKKLSVKSIFVSIIF